MKESKQIIELWYNDGHKVLGESNSSKIETLYKIYNKDKYKARIYYMNDTSDFTKYHLTLFTKKNGDFSFVIFSKTYGISISNKIYSRESRVFELHFSKNKFTLISKPPKRKQQIFNPTFNKIHECLNGFLSLRNHNYNNRFNNNVILELLSKRFAWVRFISDTPSLRNIALNTFINKKLYTLKDALKYKFKCPYPVAKLILKSNKQHIIQNITHYINYIDNIQNLKEEFLTIHSSIFYDTLRMAKIVNKKVNASWSIKRLTQEHDNWSKIITDVMFIDSNREMSIKQLFKDFAEFSNYKLLTTTSEMAHEGKRMNHCVATYVNKVESGACAIFSIQNHTLELVYVYDYKTLNPIIHINQLKGYKNQEAPITLQNEIIQMVENFNLTISEKNKTITVGRPSPIVPTIENNLPF